MKILNTLFLSLLFTFNTNARSPVRVKHVQPIQTDQSVKAVCDIAREITFMNTRLRKKQLYRDQQITQIHRSKDECYARMKRNLNNVCKNNKKALNAKATMRIYSAGYNKRAYSIQTINMPCNRSIIF